MTPTEKWSERLLLVLLVLSLSAGPANAQQISYPAAAQESKLTESEIRAGNNFHSSFASSEFAAGSVIVRGAPFSAVGIKETTQILSDGRRITRKGTASIYRDNEGRARYEWGNSKKTEGRPGVPIIHDAVTGALYLGRTRLGPARRLPIPPDKVALRQPNVITPESPPDNITQVVGEKIEPLGTKIIEGLRAEGVLVTTTIPASEMANGLPGKIVYERWYSQELRRNLLIQVTDPRFGEATYRLTNIDRAEPSRELFVVSGETETDSFAERGKDEQVTVKLQRGDKVAVDNRTTGRIVIIGWDKDEVEARATSTRGVELVKYAIAGDSPGKSVWLKADYAKRKVPDALLPQPKPETSSPQLKPEPVPRAVAEPPNISTGVVVKPAPSDVPKQIRMPSSADDGDVISPPIREGRPMEVDLEVRVPRYVEIDVIKVNKSGVEITGVETPLNIFGDNAGVILRNVGVAEVHTRSGIIDIEKASGFVDVISTSGPIRVRNAGGDVRAFSISGDVVIECSRGRVNVDSTSGSITLTNIHGDADATTSNSRVFFSGPISPDGRYHLKSMSGSVEMAIRDKPSGFTATLSSYRGVIENEFQLKINQASQHEENVNRRIVGRFGNGQALITLDTFDGRVRLTKLAQGTSNDCR